MKLWQKLLFVSSAILLSPSAFAHGSHVASGFMAGVSHPLSGVDHIVTLLLAGLLIGRFAAGKIKLVLPAISLLMVVYIWVHGAEMLSMNGSFIAGFVLTSVGVITLVFVADKQLSSSLKNIRSRRA